LKTTILLIGSIFLLASCGPNNTQKDIHSPSSEEIANRIVNGKPQKAVKDTNVNTGQKNNKFKNDWSAYSVDKKSTKLLEGSWELNGDTPMEFLQTSLKPKAKVVFSDASSVTVTAWGELHFNSTAKFYFTESGSHIYEYYITPDKQLVLTQFNYYNTDLSYKEIPTLITATYSISFTDKNTIEVFNDFQRFKFSRITA
jgi:hypothetical protein